MAYNFPPEPTDTDSPWDDDPFQPDHNREAQWAKLSSDFTNAGYREGITAGKESSLQEGFDAGFAHVGAPLGREIGVLRGACAALISYLHLNLSAGDNTRHEELMREAQDVSTRLANIRFSDIAPRDREAEQHALEHLADEEGMDVEVEGNEEIAGRRKMEQLEDMLGRLSATNEGVVGRKAERPSMEDVRKLTERLHGLMQAVGLNVNWS